MKEERIMEQTFFKIKFQITGGVTIQKNNKWTCFSGCLNLIIIDVKQRATKTQ